MGVLLLASIWTIYAIGHGVYVLIAARSVRGHSVLWVSLGLLGLVLAGLLVAVRRIWVNESERSRGVNA